MCFLRLSSEAFRAMLSGKSLFASFTTSFTAWKHRSPHYFACRLFDDFLHRLSNWLCLVAFFLLPNAMPRLRLLAVVSGPLWPYPLLALRSQSGDFFSLSDSEMAN
jgi:hypothetical protein